jgi:type II secretion system protein G
MMKKAAFTLIELLVVVAIIAILAAIALPNFLEAQTRAKVSRVKADMQSMATAIETYAVDHNDYPYDYYGIKGTDWDTWRHVTTPIAYMTSYSYDIFYKEPTPYDYGCYKNRPTPAQIWGYQAAGVRYIFLSIGPDRIHDYDWSTSGETGFNLRYQILNWTYDPTNGTVSRGDIMRTDGMP